MGRSEGGGRRRGHNLSAWRRAAQIPSAAANPKGPYLPKELTEHRPSLQSEFQNLALEQALDAALANAREARARREAQAASSQQ